MAAIIAPLSNNFDSFTVLFAACEHIPAVRPASRLATPNASLLTIQFSNGLSPSYFMLLFLVW